MPQVKLLCGCVTSNIESRVNTLTMDSVYFDDEGLLRCAIHHTRRYGWASRPIIKTTDNKTVETFYDCTPAQIEGYLVFKEPIMLFEELDIQFSKFDSRDDRDPEIFYYKEVQHRRDRNGVIINKGPDEPGKGMDLLKRGQRL